GMIAVLCITATRTARFPERVKGGKARIEQMWCWFDPEADPQVNELCNWVIRSNLSKLPTAGDPRLASQRPVPVPAKSNTTSPRQSVLTRESVAHGVPHQ